VGGQEQEISEQYIGKIISASVSCDGTRISVTDTSGTLFLYDPDNPKQAISTLPHMMRLSQFSPDGKLLASCSRDGHLHVQQTGVGHLIAQSAVDGAQKVAVLEFSPDSQHIITVNDMDTIQVWHAEARFRVGHNLGMASTAALNEGERTKEQVTGTPALHHMPQVQFTKKSCRLLDYYHGARILDMDGSVLYEDDENGRHKTDYYSTDGSCLVQELILRDGGIHNIRVLDLSTLSIIYEGDAAPGYRVDPVISPDGSFVAGKYHSVVDNGIQVWKLGAGRTAWKVLTGLQGRCKSFAFTSDSSMLAAYDGNGHFCAWGINSGDLVAQAEEHHHHWTRPPVPSFCNPKDNIQ